MENAKAASQFDVDVGARLRRLRRDKRLSQTDLGKLIGGISFQQVQKYENGTNRLSLSRAVQIAGILEVPLARLLGDDGADVRGLERETAELSRRVEYLMRSVRQIAERDRRTYHRLAGMSRIVAESVQAHDELVKWVNDPERERRSPSQGESK